MHPADALTERLGLPIRDRDLLAQALVHSSWLHEHPDAARGHNERLEFLGDAVVSLAVSEALYLRHPADDEGVLSARRAAIVSTPGLARLAAAAGPRLVPVPGRGRGPARRTRAPVAARLGLRGAGRRHLPRPRLGRRPGLDPPLGGGGALRRLGADHAQEPQEPAPGAHPADDGRPAAVPAARGRRPRPREAVPDRGRRGRPGAGRRRGSVPAHRRDVGRRGGARGAASGTAGGPCRTGRRRAAFRRLPGPDTTGGS